MPVLEVVESCVTAVFICYAKDSEALRFHDPALHKAQTPPA